jgi:hypothetical protein
VTGLPINASTGLISGTPTATGTSSVTVVGQAMDRRGQSRRSQRLLKACQLPEEAVRVGEVAGVAVLGLCGRCGAPAAG